MPSTGPELLSAADKPPIEVAVGVLEDEVGRVLLSRRAEGSHQGGLWEFPGGKREPGESLLQALARELDEELGVRVERKDDASLTLTPPDKPFLEPDTIIDCGNSGTTARLLAGLVAGTDLSVILSGDESLSSRPMKRIVEPLTEMGAELIDTEGLLPLTVRGKELLPFEYRMPVASAQVKS